jgi:hypothetical protein
MFRHTILIATFVLGVAAFVPGQSPSPTPTSEERLAELQRQIELLKKQQEFEKAKSDLANQRLKEIIEALPKNTGLKVPESKTTFSDEAKPSAETSALSYDALKAISEQIASAMQPVTSQYTGIVIHNDADFTALAKYRVYKSQSTAALKNFEAWRKKVEQAASRNGSGGDDIRIKSWDPIASAISFPTIATAVAGSVGELLSLFRTETAISESTDTIDGKALGTAIAHQLKKANGGLKVLYPEAFVPEYDLESEGRESILIRVSEINQAFVEVTSFLAWANKLTDAQRSSISVLVEEARIVKGQLQALAVTNEDVGGDESRGDDADNRPRQQYSDLRQLVRAEKVDRFIRQGTGGRIGILKVRSLASGGSRRETRNLFLGNKIRYSGSVTLELLLFDMDGMLQASEIFSAHTGFKRLTR